MDPLVIALTFGAIFLVELPDKTFIATLVLSTKFRPLLVWIGVGLAFLVQTLIAVGLGKVIAQLPTDWVRLGAAAMFLIGAVLLFREARGADAAEGETEEEFAARAGGTPKAGLAAIGASFLVLFAAEWGDLSQLLTALAGREVRRPGQRVPRRLGRAARGERPGRGARAGAAVADAALDAALRRLRGLPAAVRHHRVGDRGLRGH